MDLTEFKEIPEYPDYLISREGRVYSKISNKLLSIRTNTTGYKYFGVENGTKNILLSRALARVYKDLPSLTSDLEVDHDDTDISNNDLDNLIVRSKLDHYEKTCFDRGISPPKQSFCKVCGIRIAGKSTYCLKHYSESKVKDNSVSAEQIEYWVSNYSWVRAAKELGYSDNGLRKRYKALTGKDPKSIKKPD
ncbi:putative HNH endonuclease [Escherichia phage JLBYU43]|uniref:HNH endonuclease n=1 Tax=Escherichia phage JLBYU43 TaxID=2894751 RepID=A0AAE9CFL5_9CAUD|nr:putative HNH endonuclease [Escherichia phage JLBYU43]